MLAQYFKSITFWWITYAAMTGNGIQAGQEGMANRMLGSKVGSSLSSLGVGSVEGVR